jgi:hypothetical protein
MDDKAWSDRLDLIALTVISEAEEPIFREVLKANLEDLDGANLFTVNDWEALAWWVIDGLDGVE